MDSDKQEETQGTIIRATTSKTGNLEKTASATRYSPTRPPKLLDTALDRKKEEDLNQHSDNDKKDDSEMLIRENSSIDSDDQLDIPDNIKTQLPRDSFLNNTQSVIRDRKSFIKSQLDDTTFTIQKKINLQDKLQKELFLEKGELKEERLMAEDNELEKILRVLVERKLKIALNLKKEYNIALNRIDAVIYARMNIINQQSQNIPFLKNIQHKVPTFILQNIQLYETVFSFLKLHPCYIMSIISTHLLNNSQVNQLINILYNNPISTTSSICSLISLSQMVFDFEIKNYFKITEIKNFKIGSIFWQIYLIMFFKQEENKIFLISFAKTIILELFCKYYYDEENLASKASDFERNKIMQKALEFQEEEFQVGLFY